jgi:hypothetical protein
MDDSRIQSLITELDEAIPREGAVVRIEYYGGGPDECYAVANRRGYLRLGIEFLRAAYAPERDATSRQLAVDLGYVLDPDSEVDIDWLERKEDLQAGVSTSSRAYTWQRRVVPLVVVTFLGLFLISAVVGFVTLLRWLTAG